MKKYIHVILVAIFLLSLFSFTSPSNIIYLKVSSQRLYKNQVVKSLYEILVNFDNGEMQIHYQQPEEFYVSTNKLGEMKVYYPSKNEVLIKQNFLFSSENDPIYHFFTNQSLDLGLSQMGFILKNSVLDSHYLVTEWDPPIHLMNQLLKVKLVQESDLPIYISFFDTEGNEKQKIYYSDWEMDYIAVFPQRIMQIDYIADNDSIISRKMYSDMKVGAQAKEQFPAIIIPANAKPIIQKEK